MSDSLLNKVHEENPLSPEMLKTMETLAENSESLLNAADLEKANSELADHLSVYDEPDITPASKHEEYPNGIPSYEIQAQIVFNNYMNNANRLMSGKEKRRLFRECLRNAKKGRYEYMFDKEKIAKKEERMRKNFEKLNKPQ